MTRVHNHLSSHRKDAALRSHPHILVAASPVHIAELSLSANAQQLASLHLIALDPHAHLSPDLLADAALLVIEVEPGDQASLRRLELIRESHRQIPVVAAINGASFSLARMLVRQGITDVVALPFDISELMQAVLDAEANREVDAATPTALAPMVTIARSLGGVGATSIATQLAVDFAANDTSGRGVVVVDLDLQFGTVADYLGVRPRGSLVDLVDAGERLDGELLRSVATDAGDGIFVIGAPEMIMPLESVDVDELLRTLRLLREQFGYVILDLPANWTNWTLSAALEADTVLLVVELTIASLRQAKRRLELFKTVGIEDKNVKIVVNRLEKRLFRTIDLDDVTQALGHPVLGSVALDAPTVSASQNQGKLVSQLHRKSRFAGDVMRIGELLRAGPLARGA